MAYRRLALWLMHSLIALVGTITFALMAYSYYTTLPPLEWNSSFVHPTIVRAGENINVTRSFTVYREVNADVNRLITNGDCSKQCRMYELGSSTFNLRPGNYQRTLTTVIPEYIEPGEYVLDYSFHWRNIFGVVYSVKHPRLVITVVR